MQTATARSRSAAPTSSRRTLPRSTSACSSKPWLSGAIYFLLQDSVAYFGYTGGNPWPDPPFLHKGLLDFQGHPKPAWQVVADIGDDPDSARASWSCIHRPVGTLLR